MKTKHTKGKWKITHAVRGVTYVKANTKYIALIYDLSGDGRSNPELEKEQEANAKLIASAPELLENLKKLVDIVDADSAWHYETLAAAKEAIKKATA